MYHQHEQQMGRFRQVWGELFDKLDRKEHVMKLRLQVEQDREVREVSEGFRAKMEKIERKSTRDKRIRDLENLEARLLAN